jgi:hypothetical protein
VNLTADRGFMNVRRVDGSARDLSLVILLLILLRMGVSAAAQPYMGMILNVVKATSSGMAPDASMAIPNKNADQSHPVITGRGAAYRAPILLAVSCNVESEIEKSTRQTQGEPVLNVPVGRTGVCLRKTHSPDGTLEDL